MSNTLEKSTTQANKIKQNLTRASEIAKELPDKLNQLHQANMNLNKEKEMAKKENEELKGRVNNLDANLLSIKTEFDQKLKTSENKIVSLQRELEIARDDLKSKISQNTAKDERINVLESQNKELMENLRRRSE
jgi:chromosome segregation ATPase